MKLYINDEVLTTSSEITLEELMVQLDHKTKPGIAVAVNQSIIQRNHWAQTSLNDNDQIIIIRATQGG